MPTWILRRLEVWRLITPFFNLGKLDFHFLMLLVYIMQYGVKLEQDRFRNRTPDFVWMMLFSMVVLLATTLVLPRVMLGPQLIMVLVYLWSRAYPSANVSFMGVVTLQAFYLPLVFVVLSLCMGGDWLGELMGVLVGHLYYFLTELHPAAGGRELLRTPNWLKRQVLAAGFGQVDVREVQMANPADPRFRAFAGQGRRLAD
ncbi:hypothetical protein WJX81_001804 [Elliptochloris bilobata]|uniref:Derlin n=1 Tax=Elliptochloris bilobata TaxID=381761 RepID=A0AAW1RBN9_9CHLO